MMTIEDVFHNYGLKIQPYYDKHVLINNSFNTIVPEIIFDKISLYVNKYFLIQNDGLYGLYDFLGNCILECNYSVIKHCNGDIFIVCDAYNYFGIINSVGNKLIDLLYSRIEVLDDCRLAVYNHNNECALFAYSGEQLTNFNYAYIEPWVDTFYMVAMDVSDIGIINAFGCRILPCKFDTIDICDGFFKVSTLEYNDYGPNKTEVGLYSCYGKEIIPCKYKDIIVESDYILAVEERRTDIFPLGHYEKVYGVFSKLGKQLTPCIYREIEYSAENRIFTLSKNSSSQHDYIDEFGRHCLFVDGLYIPFSNIEHPELLQNNLVKALKSGSKKCGIITLTGKVIIDFKYEDISPVSNNIFICRCQNFKLGFSPREKEYNTYDIVRINKDRRQILLESIEGFSKIVAYNYQKLDVVSSEIFIIKLKSDGGNYRLMLNTGEIVTPYPIKVEPGIHGIDLISFKLFAQGSHNYGKVGFYNVPKKILIEPQYDGISFNPYTNSMSFNYSWDSSRLRSNENRVIAIVQINEKYGAIDAFGKLVIPVIYEILKFVKNGIYAETSGYAYIYTVDGSLTKRYLIDEDELYRRAREAEAANRAAARQYEADLKDELDDIINNGGDWILDN